MMAGMRDCSARRPSKKYGDTSRTCACRPPASSSRNTSAGAAGEQIAAVGRAVVAGGNRFRRLGGHHRRAHRHAAAERLAQRDEIRRESRGRRVPGIRPVRPAPLCTSSAIEQRAGARARRRRSPSPSPASSGRTPPSPCIGSTMIAAVFASTAAESAAGSAPSTNDTPGISGWNGAAIVLVPRHRQRSHRPAMERVRERDVLRAVRLALRVPVPARELEAGLVRFRAAVAEERARESRERGQPRGQLALQRMKVQVRRVRQRRRLLAERARESRMRVPERRHADAGHEVQIRRGRDRRTAACRCRVRTPPAGACRSAARAAIRVS